MAEPASVIVGSTDAAWEHASTLDVASQSKEAISESSKIPPAALYDPPNAAGETGAGLSAVVAPVEPAATSAEPAAVMAPVEGETPADEPAAAEMASTSTELAADATAIVPLPAAGAEQATDATAPTMVAEVVADGVPEKKLYRVLPTLTIWPTVRAGIEYESAKVGELAPGSVFEVLEEANSTVGVHRVRTTAGWASSSGKDGHALLEPVEPAVEGATAVEGTAVVATVLASDEAAATLPTPVSPVPLVAQIATAPDGAAAESRLAAILAPAGAADLTLLAAAGGEHAGEAEDLNNDISQDLDDEIRQAEDVAPAYPGVPGVAAADIEKMEQTGDRSFDELLASMRNRYESVGVEKTLGLIKTA